MNRIAPASPIVDLSDGIPPLESLAPAASALGGVRRAVEITSPEVVLTPVSPSFHARDVLAPAAAHLAAGADLAALGHAFEPSRSSS
jgi:S-adenosylmethionine hydrolase